MNVHISPFITAYRKNYKKQHVLLKLLEEWKEHLKNNKTMGRILMDFLIFRRLLIAFYRIPHLHNQPVRVTALHAFLSPKQCLNFVIF